MKHVMSWGLELTLPVTSEGKYRQAFVGYRVTYSPGSGCIFWFDPACKIMALFMTIYKGTQASFKLSTMHLRKMR